ncbi:hypothetical protein K0M31_008397 [Melipona bicolor]|uniref:Uncharacterized protein n=1 Tax=Melipona bicolor TaxID=60889 RepID=A0AA40KKJ6_9HYME|nr:hypothetical protein K0M31_008397 [Melipona bicolor]
MNELLRGTGDSVIVKNRIYQCRAVPVAVQQRLNGGRRRVEQRRHRRRFVVNDLRRRGRAESDLMHLRWLNGRGTDTLVAEQLIRGRLLIVRPFPVVENVLVMVAAVFVVVEGLGLTCVNLRERWLRLEVLRVACRVGEGAGGWRGGEFAWFRGGCRGCGRRRGSCRRGSLMVVYGVRLVDVVLAVLVQTASRNGIRRL